MEVPPLGPQLKSATSTVPAAMVGKLAAAQVPLADEYPLPLFELEG
jgi:hypothetical protein